MELNATSKERIEWIDTAKAIGMYLIYLGHYGEKAGLAYSFVFSFHVHFFFFLSGCVSVYNRRNTVETILNRARTILVPFFTFGILAVFLKTVQSNSSENLTANLKILLLGATRNQFTAPSLWFLTGLFFVELLFCLIKKLRYKWLMLLSALLIAVLQHFVISKQFGYPALYYNIDSAFRYLIYFALGHCLMFSINNFLKSADRTAAILKYVSGFASFLYCALLFIGKDLLAPVSHINGTLSFVCAMIRALICIWFFILVSFSLRGSIRLRWIGQNSLYLCVSEYFIRNLSTAFIALLGGELLVKNPLQAFLGAGILIILSMYLLVPAEKKLMEILLPTAG
jgi:fucose 4-O-acetylase-like acetyltransferase